MPRNSIILKGTPSRAPFSNPIFGNPKDVKELYLKVLLESKKQAQRYTSLILTLVLPSHEPPDLLLAQLEQGFSTQPVSDDQGSPVAGCKRVAGIFVVTSHIRLYSKVRSR